MSWNVWVKKSDARRRERLAWFVLETDALYYERAARKDNPAWEFEVTSTLPEAASGPYVPPSDVHETTLEAMSAASGRSLKGSTLTASRRETHATYCGPEWTERGLHATECLAFEVTEHPHPYKPAHVIEGHGIRRECETCGRTDKDPRHVTVARCVCGKTRAEHHGCTWFVVDSEGRTP